MPSPEGLHIQDIQNLTSIYRSFGEIERAVPWAGREDRMENDAEHSYSLALIGMALGAEIGLNPEKIAKHAIVHDLPEVYAGDVSVWDEEARKTKAEKEAAAVIKIKTDLSTTPFLGQAVDDYHNLIDEEARFIYALDKLMPLIMIVADNGNWFRENGITYEKFLRKHTEKRAQVAQHPAVLQWYDEMFAEVERRKDELFASAERT